ncbi:MAG TPA: class I SAM-dependent methyltransferase, partial [Acidobacteriaceae bacterium]|nr:class I SAM-dependent methyltransferase [Acidobacteriaceae bacterium]
RGTFRDPAGSLRIVQDRVLRRVLREHAGPAVRFLQSPLAAEWVRRGNLVETHFLSETDGELTLEHPRIFFPSYPWEWTPSAWLAAAHLTLDFCDSLLDQGLILKDATPLNILFRGTQPVFVDVLSVDQRDPESPLWLAYAQFVRTFLLPLIAHKYLGWPLAATIRNRDGYEPGDLAPYLSRWQRWREPFRSLVTLPLMLESNQSRQADTTAKVRQPPAVALQVLRRNLAALRKHLQHLDPQQQRTRWSTYTISAEHYSADDHQQKQAFVREALTAAQPHRVLDLGGNTGVYSRIAAECGAEVVSWDTDAGATEQHWREAQRLKLPDLPLIANPARPTPPVGWRNAESLGLLERAQGRFDCVMMLGFIHHLLLAEQIPLPEIAAQLRDLTTKWAIVEWVPAQDPRFRDLLRGRDALYSHLDETAFSAAVDPHFAVVQRTRLPNGRTLFLLRSR